MIPGSLLLATAPQRFPADRLGFSACHAAECGFAVVDSVRESGAAAPGKCRRCCVRDWPGARRRSAPTLPQRGLCGCAASPRPVFSAPAHGTRSRVLRLEREHSALQEAFPLYTVLPKRRGEDRKGGDETKESNRQHTGKRPVATARAVAIKGQGRVPVLQGRQASWPGHLHAAINGQGRVPVLPQSVLVAS